MRKASIGDLVIFVTPEGKERPAIITQVWSPTSGMATMSVFTDQPNDNIAWTRGLPVVCVTSVDYSEEPAPRTWHWKEEESA